MNDAETRAEHIDPDLRTAGYRYGTMFSSNVLKRPDKNDKIDRRECRFLLKE